jgi:hypothetical protein
VSAPPLEDDIAGVVTDHARELRDSGVEWVVALFHDGVDWSFGRRGSGRTLCGTVPAVGC